MEAEGLMHRKGEESISLLRALYVCLFEESNYLNIIKTFVYPYTYRGVCVAQEENGLQSSAAEGDLFSLWLTSGLGEEASASSEAEHDSSHLNTDG